MEASPLVFGMRMTGENVSNVFCTFLMLTLCNLNFASTLRRETATPAAETAFVSLVRFLFFREHPQSVGVLPRATAVYRDLKFRMAWMIS